MRISEYPGKVSLKPSQVVQGVNGKGWWRSAEVTNLHKMTGEPDLPPLDGKKRRKRLQGSSLGMKVCRQRGLFIEDGGKARRRLCHWIKP